MTYAELARKLGLVKLTQAQEKAVMADKERRGFTLLLAMRSWEFAAFAALRR